MKTALLLLLAIFAGGGAFGAGMTSVDLDGNSYSNITRVYAGPGGRIIILYPGGGTSATADKLPADFLASWMSPGAVAQAQASQAETARANLDHAISAGCFREVGGIVYDIRQPQSGWVTFTRVKPIQVLDDGAIIDATPSDSKYLSIFVRRIPPVADTDTLTFSALPAGTYSYINQNHTDRTIHAYDYGRVCTRDEIPAEVLSGEVPYKALPVKVAQQMEAPAAALDAPGHMRTGTGFFVGSTYVLTSNHTVSGARNIIVQIDTRQLPGTVVHTDEANDLALLSVPELHPFLAISTNQLKVKPGDPVYTMGFLHAGANYLKAVTTGGTITGVSGMNSNSHEYTLQMAVPPSGSGGPLFDPLGNVIGMVVSSQFKSAASDPAGPGNPFANCAITGDAVRMFLGAGPRVESFGAIPVVPTNPYPAIEQTVALVMAY